MKPSHYTTLGWCQGSHAQDGDGKRCNPHSPEAAAWSLYGAYLRARWDGYPFPEGAVARLLADNAMDGMVHGQLEEWNDQPRRTQSEVIDFLVRHGL